MIHDLRPLPSPESQALRSLVPCETCPPTCTPSPLYVWIDSRREGMSMQKTRKYNGTAVPRLGSMILNFNDDASSTSPSQSPTSMKPLKIKRIREGLLTPCRAEQGLSGFGRTTHYRQEMDCTNHRRLCSRFTTDHLSTPCDA